MKYIYATLNWFFGVTTAVAGLSMFLQKYPMAGLSFIAISMLLLPPVRNFIFSKTGNELSVKNRSVLILGLIIASGFFINTSSVEVEKRENAEKAKILAETAAKEKKQNIEYFEKNSVKIIQDTKNALESENYQDAIKISSKYVSTGNTEIVALYKQASEKYEEYSRIEKTKTILESIEKINKTEYEKYSNAYQELVKLNPNNNEYKSLLKVYQGKLKDQKDKEAFEAAERKKREEIINRQNSNPESFVTLEKFSWYKDGFGSVMMANFVIKNSLPWPVKDIIIQCNHSAPSGTAIDSNLTTIYEKIEPGKSKSIKDFNMGFINTQASSSSCVVKDIVVIK